MKTKVSIASLSLLAVLCLALSAPAFADLYNNGPTNGTSNAYFIDVYRVSDGFWPNHNGHITSFTFAEWVPTGATPLTVDWAISSRGPMNGIVGEGLNTPYSSLVPICQNGGGECGGGFGYDVYDATVNVGSIAVTKGKSDWLNLWGATDNFAGRDGWDINSGHSVAFHNLLGRVPSESFTINGTSFVNNANGIGNAPEPSSIALLGSGVLGLAGILRRRLSP